MFIARIQDAHLPAMAAPQPEVADIVKNIALRCLKELAISLSSGIVVALFVASPGGIVFIFSASAVQLAVSVFFQSLGAFAAYKAAQRNENLECYEKTVSVCEWITGSNFALLTGYNAQTLIHESGHALASLLVYKNPRPLIEIYPFVGGITQFYKTSLSMFGKKIGPAAATCLVVASGPGLTLLISSALLSIGIALKEKYPQLGKYLITWSILDFFNHAFYAYTALRADQWNLSHDFVHLSIFGLHPVAATVGIAAIPVVIALGAYWWQSQQQKETKSAQLAIV